MTKKKTPKLIAVSEVNARLVLPGGSFPITRNSLYLRLQKLGITPVMKTPEEGPKYPVGFVTEEQAAIIETDFKNGHWRKAKKIAEAKAAAAEKG